MALKSLHPNKHFEHRKYLTLVLPSPITFYRHPLLVASPNLRPPMNRLETIHSQSSAGEPSPYFAHKAMVLGRQPSRAERSAAKNIKDAKKKGWRASMQRGDKKVKKDRIGDGASSAGWTDVSRDSAFGHKQSRGNGDEKSSKCAIM
ncbi:hypothetical protein L207DRAFT_35536 [Hyaloscypha variabilis F]|uniref:Uncharacterized protein n=1 Tax=Hyaloscypha variabilis (strain UAMH 11265 / GT02V1 / F) TaxID=1149755 RepID=A0A2J6RNA7_HYAVF|nr:hypothetical protein L207DRAFT_35536 [Hyaloscypha variabilis F]